MSELVLAPLLHPSETPTNAGAVTAHQPVFWYTSTFKNGTITHTENKNACEANVNYVKNALGMWKQEYGYEMTETVTKANNEKIGAGKTDYITTKKEELKIYNNELAHNVLTLLHRAMWRQWETPKDKCKCYLWTVDINEAFEIITGAISGLRSALNDILEMKYPSAVSTKMITDSLAMRKLQIQQKSGTELEKLNKKVKKPKK